MHRHTAICAMVVATAAAITPGRSASAAMVRPDSATAVSEFSSLYDIGNAIDGSGLPANFTPADAHADYVTHNHWTTASGAVQAGTARASFFFDDPTTLGAFYLWNHRSTITTIAANPDYDVQLFDLVFRDGAGTEIGSALGLVAAEDIAIAQTFLFAEINGVRQVDFIIRSTHGSTSYTGVAEVAFDTVPTPPTAVGILMIAAMPRRRPLRAGI